MGGLTACAYPATSFVRHAHFKHTTMKTSTRRRFGSALLGVAIIGAAVLQYAGFGFRGVQHKSTPNVEWTGISFHWALFIAGAFATAGFLCLIIPGRSDDRVSHHDV